MQPEQAKKKPGYHFDHRVLGETFEKIGKVLEVVQNINTCLFIDE